MFVQLRRVVYLLVLLQCCACVAYAESVETSRPAGTIDVSKVEEKLQGFGITAKELFQNGSIAVHVLYNNVETLQEPSKEIELLADITKGFAENRSEQVTSDSEGESDEGPSKEMVEQVKGTIKSAADAAEIVSLAIRYCKHWSDILDEVITGCDGRTDEPISSESDGDFLDITTENTYERLCFLRAHISAATKRGNDTVEVVKKHEKVVEDALDKLNVSNDTLKKEIEEIHDDAKKNSTTAFKEILKKHGVETMFLKIKEEKEETPDLSGSTNQSREDSIIPPGVPPQQPSASQQEAPAETATVEHAPAEQAPQAQSSAPEESSSLESPERPTADVPKEQTANTAETGNSDAATPTPTPTAAPTTTTTAAALIEANKKGLQNAASGPMSSTAVLAVLALTVSTVIGMTVV